MTVKTKPVTYAARGGDASTFRRVIERSVTMWSISALSPCTTNSKIFARQ